MAKKQSQTSAAAKVMHADRLSESAHSHKAISAAELLSFLKETRAIHTWTDKDLAQTLNLSSPQAKNAIAVLQLEGYIEAAGSTEKWRITEQGELVSGAKPPRFTRHSVEDAFAALRDRIKSVNEDRNVPYRITDAVAFGDFLGDAVRVQAAEVGIRLVPKTEGNSIASAKEHADELKFLKELRGKSSVLHVIPYENWMSSRSHQPLL